MKRKHKAGLVFIAVAIGTAIIIKKTNNHKSKDLLPKDEEEDDSIFEDEL